MPGVECPQVMLQLEKPAIAGDLVLCHVVGMDDPEPLGKIVRAIAVAEGLFDYVPELVAAGYGANVGN